MNALKRELDAAWDRIDALCVEKAGFLARLARIDAAAEAAHYEARAPRVIPHHPDIAEPGSW